MLFPIHNYWTPPCPCPSDSGSTASAGIEIGCGTHTSNPYQPHVYFRVVKIRYHSVLVNETKLCLPVHCQFFHTVDSEVAHHPLLLPENQQGMFIQYLHIEYRIEYINSNACLFFLPILTVAYNHDSSSRTTITNMIPDIYLAIPHVFNLYVLNIYDR